MNQPLTVLGLMSGTSLDGLDICCAQFSEDMTGFHYRLIACETFAYTDEWKNKLKEAYNRNHDALSDIDKEFGIHIGTLTKHFMLKHDLVGKVDLIGSHGQTIFHQPEKGITVQIGKGAEIANITELPVVNDFRIKDVQLGGQGAPLVPIGDKFLFGEFDACMNLGGIANISLERDGKRIAWDICPCNLPTNRIVSEAFGVEYDRGGEMAASGETIEDLLNDLNALDYYQQAPPKSLGYEWLDAHFYPLINKHLDRPKAHILRTIVEHETRQVANVLNKYHVKACLFTGGGVLNAFWMNSLKSKTNVRIEIPDLELINFKEALIFGFLAYLRKNNEINTLASVTGAKEDSIGGILHAPPA